MSDPIQLGLFDLATIAEDRTRDVRVIVGDVVPSAPAREPVIEPVADGQPVGLLWLDKQGVARRVWGYVMIDGVLRSQVLMDQMLTGMVVGSWRPIFDRDELERIVSGAGWGLLHGERRDIASVRAAHGK